MRIGPKIASAPVCRNPRCASGAGSRLQRHHRGCERMFVRHFEWRSGEAKYQEYCRRYEMFHTDDIVHLCDNCHEAIHVLYLPHIADYAASKRRQLPDFSWDMARELIGILQQLCDYHIQRGYDARRILGLPAVPRRRTENVRCSRDAQRGARPKRRGR